MLVNPSAAALLSVLAISLVSLAGVFTLSLGKARLERTIFLLVAFAVGFAVSVSQYLPTVFAGGGRLETLTTEAVSLAGGGDRRLIGMLVFAQSVLPFLAFLLAAALPAWLFRNRQGMRGIS